MYCNINGTLRHVLHVVSDEYISFAVATNLDTWFPTDCMLGILSEYLRLYIYFITDMYIKFVG